MKKKTLPGRTGGHTAPPKNAPRGNKKLLIAGWSFLGLVILLAAAAVIWLLRPEKEEAPLAAPPVTAADSAAPVGIAAEAPKTFAPAKTGGKHVEIRRLLCDFTEPTELTFGILAAVDISSIGETVAANVKAAGWGNVEVTASSGGTSGDRGEAMLLRSTEAPVLTAGDLEKQKEFLASDRPEAMARTFLEDSGLIRLLEPFGITVSTEAENDGGEITFRSTGGASGSECSITFSFLYTGSFNQARIRCTGLTQAQTTADVVPLSRAVSRAAAWEVTEDGPMDVTEIELRCVRGLPFYVFHGEDGRTAYALAVSEKALAALPEAVTLYEQLMESGIRELTVIPGAE